jgi:hypothetical protein
LVKVKKKYTKTQFLVSDLADNFYKKKWRLIENARSDNGKMNFLLQVWQGLIQGMKAIEQRSDGEEFNLGEFTTKDPRLLATTAQPNYMERYSSHRTGGAPISW